MLNHAGKGKGKVAYVNLVERTGVFTDCRFHLRPDIKMFHFGQKCISTLQISTFVSLRQRIWVGCYRVGVLERPKTALFPGVLWLPTLRRALWRCRNVGFPRPQCRVTAPISAVWWPEEEATEILAWRKKREGRRRWERQERDFLLQVGDLRWYGRTRLWRDPDVSLWAEHRLLSAPLCRCVSPLGGSEKNWVRGVPLLGS